MSFIEKARTKLSAAFDLRPGDTVQLKYSKGHPDGTVTQETVLESEVEEEMTVDEGVVFELTDEFGMERGIGGALGHSSEGDG